MEKLCEHCEIDVAKYSYKDMSLCEDCMFDRLDNDEVIQSSSNTSYYLDGEFIGDTDEGLELEISEIAEKLNIKELVINE